MGADNGPIPALVPRSDAGCQFVVYGDSCSGVPRSPHEANFSAVNGVVAKLRPQPGFICFLGDEIRGLTADATSLRRQWAYWIDHEMAWLDRRSIALYHTTGNHTTYDVASETVFREVLSHLPRNGPPGQEGLAYYVRRNDLLMVFVNTMFSQLGGEGRVETQWLSQTLMEHADARYKLVFGHHPVHPVNGFSGEIQREIAADNGRELWKVLVGHGVMAYLCSHILAFDVQVHDGVLQVLTAGAGTEHRMPEDIEYLHCVQAAIDEHGLRFQVLHNNGRVREWLSWPLVLPSSESWPEFVPDPDNAAAALHMEKVDSATAAHVVVWKFAGQLDARGRGAPQTLLCGWRHEDKNAIGSLWIGLQGREQRLVVKLCQAPQRSAHYWLGPELPATSNLEIQVAVHTGMGPGGVLWRWDDAATWSSLTAASPWGAESVPWPDRWSVGHVQRGSDDQSFRGQNLRVACHPQIMKLVI